MIITVTRVPIVEMNLILLDDQEVMGNHLSFVKVVYMLNRDKCFIPAIIVASSCNLTTFRLEIFRDCIKLKLSILE